MYKKLISIGIGSTLLLGLTACDSSKQSESSEKANVKSQPETKKDLTSQDELDKKLKQGATVTIYGVYDGKDKTGMPKISATVIEQ